VGVRYGENVGEVIRVVILSSRVGESVEDNVIWINVVGLCVSPLVNQIFFLGTAWI